MKTFCHFISSDKEKCEKFRYLLEIKEIAILEQIEKRGTEMIQPATGQSPSKSTCGK